MKEETPGISYDNLEPLGISSNPEVLAALPREVYAKVHSWLGDEGRRFFRHCLGLTGTVSPVLKLDEGRKHIPVHPVHFREGMQVRNFLRGLPECASWTDYDFDNFWAEVVTRSLHGEAL
jgi:hypothetical protein